MEVHDWRARERIAALRWKFQETLGLSIADVCEALDLLMVQAARLEAAELKILELKNELARGPTREMRAGRRTASKNRLVIEGSGS